MLSADSWGLWAKATMLWTDWHRRTDSWRVSGAHLDKCFHGIGLRICTWRWVWTPGINYGIVERRLTFGIVSENSTIRTIWWLRLCMNRSMVWSGKIFAGLWQWISTIRGIDQINIWTSLLAYIPTVACDHIQPAPSCLASTIEKMKQRSSNCEHPTPLLPTFLIIHCSQLALILRFVKISYLLFYQRP